jgi:hypothetical protein
LNPDVLLRTAMYGKVLVLLMIAFCLIEVMDNKVAPLTFQVYIKGQSFGISMALMGQFIVNSASSSSSKRRSRQSPSRYAKGESFRTSLCLKGLSLIKVIERRCKGTPIQNYRGLKGIM